MRSLAVPGIRWKLGIDHPWDLIKLTVSRHEWKGCEPEMKCAGSAMAASRWQWLEKLCYCGWWQCLRPRGVVQGCRGNFSKGLDRVCKCWDNATVLVLGYLIYAWYKAVLNLTGASIAPTKLDEMLKSVVTMCWTWRSVLWWLRVGWEEESSAVAGAATTRSPSGSSTPRSEANSHKK